MDNKMDARDRELLIRLDTKLDILSKDIKEIREYQEKHDGRIRAVEIAQSNNESTISVLRDEINRLRASGNIKDVLIAIGAIASILLTLLGVKVF